MAETRATRRFTVPDRWTMPDLTVLGDGFTVRQHPARVRGAYYDTAALDLTAAGVRLGRRAVDGAVDADWTLAVDGSAGTGGHLTLHAVARGVPADLRTATAGLRTGPLRRIAALDARREWHLLVGTDGAEVLRVGVDLVTAHRPDADTASRRWRAVELVGAPGGDDALVRRAARSLTKSGARGAGGDELALVVDAAAGTPHDDRTLDGLVRRYLDAQCAVIMRSDIALRGLPQLFGDADVVHQTRIAIRRYRSVLRVLSPLFDAERAAGLDTELRWWAHALGAVRDQHVLRAGVQARLEALPPELVLGPVAATVRHELDAAGGRAEAALARARRSARYPALLEAPAARIAGYLEAAERAAEEKRKRSRSATKNRVEVRHRARRAAKRLRYLAELAEPALGKPARKAGARAKQTQESLGDAQDAALAAEFLRGLGARFATPRGENGFTYGVLAAAELARAHREEET